MKDGRCDDELEDLRSDSRHSHSRIKLRGKKKGMNKHLRAGVIGVLQAKFDRLYF